VKIFDPINTPLMGTNLIEASAGTGKTYAIAGIYLRLLVEEHLTTDQILVVTFTQAATQELKDRIRNTLLKAKSAFSKGSSENDLINRLVKKHENTALAVRLIQDALIDFDNAAIFTIHGFCHRVLSKHAFETQSLFDMELVTDQTDMAREIVDDFWRTHFYNMPLEFISYASKKISGPEYFLALLAKNNAPDMRIIPELESPDLEGLDEFRNIFKRLKFAWNLSKEQVIPLLKNPCLSGTVYGSTKTEPKHTGFSKRDLKVLSMTRTMDRFVDSKSMGFPVVKDFEKFTATKLAASTRKNHTPPFHDVFNICDELYEKGLSLEAEMERCLLYLKTLFFSYAREQLPVIKEKSNIQFFDDLLIRMKKALQDTGGNELASAIRRQYKAALVDEFQDTDSVQYEIFRRLFDSKRSVLFMIGDPKQAIYSFRGADIFSYLTAAGDANSKYTLIENWRSNAGLIRAVNTIFSNVPSPFVFEQIGFEKGIPGEEIQSMDDKSSSPLIVWYWESGRNTDTSKLLNKTQAVPLIATAVTDEISRLISPGPKSWSRDESDGISAGDIAVLVRTNRQAQIIKNSLLLKRIPSVLYDTGNIFHTCEARDMERILWSISEPGSERRFKTALVTDILGVSGHKIDSADSQPFGWEPRVSNFMEYFRLWIRYGFIRMFRNFMSKEKIRERLLAFSDGERRLTNLLHLAKILHQESVEKQTGITGLMKWMSEQINTPVPESEIHQLRLESDEHAVKIITLHKSKGLEFPVVFCPFSWGGSLIKAPEIAFHDHDTKKLTLDLGSSEKDIHLTFAQNELLAENMRLLYVAVTRAIKRCYLVWGRFNTADTSAMAYLFHYGPPPEDDIKIEDLVSSLKSRCSEKKDEELLEDLKQLADKSKGSIVLVPLPANNGMEYASFEDETEEISSRQFSGKIDTSWKISSYSSMVSQRVPEEAVPDRDVSYGYTTENGLERIERMDIFSFPKGARPGLFFHDIFEHLDFTASNCGYKETLVTSKLTAYGFDSKWRDVVCRMITRVLSIPLEIRTESLTLSSVSFNDRINEMEFYYPLNPFTPQQLKKIFSDHGTIQFPGNFPDRIGKLTFPFTKGFMKGYIDMIFHEKGRYYLVDWKSNLLGTRVQDYSRDALNTVMSNDFYILQYHLYTLALYQYLWVRLPGFDYEKDFGGVFYVFLRGVDPDYGPEFGIYKDYPSPDLIHALARALIPGGDPGVNQGRW
jgi:exodeoxyribonuclease V beta subunit